MRPTFGDRLFELRTENDLTMEGLIEALNKKYPDTIKDKSIISKYESNKVKPKQFTTIENIADYFGVSVNYMTGRSNNRYDEDEFGTHKIIPIIGTIAAGIPIFAHENIEGYEHIDANFHADFCLRVKGDSMIGARILDGDLVYIRKQSDVEHGEIAAILIDDEATLKRVYKLNGNVILRAENPNHPEKTYSKKDMKDIKILGKAVYFRSEVR